MDGWMDGCKRKCGREQTENGLGEGAEIAARKKEREDGGKRDRLDREEKGGGQNA